MRKKTRVKLKRKDRWLLLAMLLVLLPSQTMIAQLDGLRGLFGRGGGNRDDTGLSNGVMNQGFDFTQGDLTDQGFGATSGGLFNQGFGFTQDCLDNQGFGSTQGGITNQTFEEETPLGSGFFILLASGAGYATLKTKKRKSNH